MAGGSNKDCSPMRTDDITFNFNANLREVRQDASGDNPDTSKSNYPPTNSYLQSAEGLEALPHNDGASSESDPDSIQQKKSGSNVIVDESPLQLQMEKNKECKFNLKYLQYNVFLAKNRDDYSKYLSLGIIIRSLTKSIVTHSCIWLVKEI